MERLDAVVIGAGVVGLACARRLALAGRDVVVLERHTRIGEETSSRNSEVIHAGIYYPTGSRKAALCVAGKMQLYDYCERNHVPFRRCGKIIVATSKAQIGALEGYSRSARENGAGELEWLDQAAIARLEPEIRAVAGVLSPSTGIIDSHAFMLSLQGGLEAHGGTLALATSVDDLRWQRPTGIVLRCADLTLNPGCVVNCAGLRAPELARLVDGQAPGAFFARGHYFGYRGKAPFSRLVYPVAEPGGLGVHVTVDLAGQVKFGPDVEWIDKVDYRFDESRKPRFLEAIQSYFPDVQADRLIPDYVGVRPKISGPGEPAADFRIDGPRVHGVPGLVNLLGIESPGLTASLAIADAVQAELPGPV